MTNQIDFDDYSKDYNNLLSKNTKFFSEDEAYFARYKIEIVRKKISAPISRVLEYGCGIGRNIPFLKAAFPSATILGSDISNESLKYARLHNPTIEFFNEIESKQTIELFDLIFVAGVFHHILLSDRLSVMTTLFNRLKENGMLIIFEHNPYNPLTRKIVNECPFDKDAVLLYPSELKKYLNLSGFLDIQNHYCLFFPPKFSRLVPLESYLSWLPLGGQYWVEAKKGIS